VNLRAVPDDETSPLSLPELKSHGDQLLRAATNAAGDALMVSVRPEFLFKRSSYDLRDVKQMRAMAREAAQAWAKVEATLSELLNEVDKSKNGSRP
jgi:hypothetical protein